MSRAIPDEYEIEEGKPLLVLSCSATKRNIGARDWVRFADLYDGPLWRDVRGSNYPLSNVAALSALYGFCAPGHAIQTYDVCMDDKRSARLCRETPPGWIATAIRKAGSAFVVGGAMYADIIRAAIRAFPDLGPLVTFAAGSFLQQRKQLGEWLRANMGEDLMKTPQIPAMPGMAPLGFMPPVSKDQAALAQRKANAPLKPTVAQSACDVGLFSDDARQLDLVDQTRR